MPPSDYLATYRLSGYAPRVHLSIYWPAPVASGTLTATPADGATALAVSFSVGSESDVKAGFLVTIRDTATGAWKGDTRVRYSGTPTSSSIPVRELTQAVVSAASGDTFEVRRYVPLDTKLTAADASFSPDGIPYSDEGSNAPPLVCSGGAWAGWVDAGQTYATIHTDGSGSAAVDPDSGGDLTHIWQLPASGVAYQTGSDGGDVSPVLEADVGAHLPYHLVVDDDNSRAGLQYVPIVVHDDAHPPYEVLLTALDGDVDTGVSWTVEVLDDAVTLDDIPYGALGILWTDDEFSDFGVRDLHRSTVTGRSHIIGIGYISHESHAGDAETGDRMTFELRSPLTRLNEIAAYSKVMLREANPDDWNEIKALTVFGGMTRLWQFYTTGQEAGFDYAYHADADDADYPAHFLQRSDPIAQLRELADARSCRLVQTERGAGFEVQLLPYMRALTDRADLDITLTDDDVYDYSYDVDDFDKIELFELQGITAGASSNAAVFSRILANGKEGTQYARVIPDSQAQADAWCGLRFAYANQQYTDADGKKQYVGQLTLKCPGVYNVLDFSGRFVKFSYAGKRVDFDTLRFWLKSYSWEVDAESGEPATTFVWQAETAAPAGVTYTPDETTITTPPVQPVQPVAPTPTRIIPETGALPTRAVILSAAGARCALVTSINPSTYALTYADRSTGLTGVGRWGYSNPFRYRQFYAAMSTGLYSMADIEAGGAFSLLMNTTALFGNAARQPHFACGSINRNGFGVAFSGYSGLAYTFDGWATRTIGAIGGGSPDWSYPNPSSDGVYSSFCMCERTSGHGYAVVGFNGNLYRTTDYCQTWNQVGGTPYIFGLDAYFRVEIPYTRANGTPNADDGSLELWVYAVGRTGVPRQSVGVYTTDGVTGITSVTANTLTNSGVDLGTDWLIRPATSFTHDGDFGYVTDNVYAGHTEDALATLVNPTTISGVNNVNGFSTNPNCAFLWSATPTGGGGNRAYFTFDGGAAWHVIAPDTPGWNADDGVAYLEGSLYTEQ